MSEKSITNNKKYNFLRQCGPYASFKHDILSSCDTNKQLWRQELWWAEDESDSGRVQSVKGD